MRKLATAAAVSLALATSGAFGLGLGDIEMRSALNQHMNAEIRLTSVKAGELDRMIVQLASPEAFARAGIERSTALTDLQFTVEPGSSVIRITSQRPVIEPFLNFLLEVDWPQGRMVREYTVLLDPPVFMTPSATRRNSSADQAVVVERGNEALVVPTPIERSTALVSAADEGIEVDLAGLNAEADAGEIVSLDLLSGASSSGSGTFTLGEGEIVSLTDARAPNTAALAQRQREARAAFDAASIEVELVGSTEEVGDTAFITERASSRRESDGSTIVSLDDLSAGSTRGADALVSVNRGDTLFEIARDNAISGVSIQQMMLALLAANESAFINNNINLVRAGAILRIPDAASARRLTQTQALASIGEQNQLWQEYRDNLRNTGATQVATARSDTEQQGSGASGSAVSTRETVASDTASSAASDSSAVDAAASAAIETAALDSETRSDGLSAEARAILEAARREILNRDELRIVADNAPTSTAASATADENGDNDAQRLGEVNRQLQLAREELSATRLQSDELSDQAGELQNTSENLDALLTLRQNEIAQLEAQLANARSAGEAAGSAAENLLVDAGSAVSGALAGAGGTAAVAANAALGSTDMVAQAAGALEAAGDTLGNAVDSGVNALTEAGETLGVVELLVDDKSSTAATGSDAGGIVPPVGQTTWYQDFLTDPSRMMIAGIGGVGILGVLGTLLYRRKRRDNDEMLDIIDESEFIDDADYEAYFQPQRAASNQASAQSGFSGAARGAAGASGVVGGDALAGLAGGREVGSEPASKAGAEKRSIDFDEMADSSLAFGSETQAVANASGEHDLDKDDTISEVDVYLAYGLHGQAEELLTRAIERAPDNPRYARKLLQTYHAQGNGEGFHSTAAEFHARFGGEDNPEWPAIAAMGAELKPDDPLYASARDVISAIGVGHSNGQALSDDDFLPALDEESGSFNRNFRSSSDAVDMREDESSLMDHSLDPAFAFDEGDLEATGDFTGIASELAAEENDGGIDFPGFSATASDTDDLTDELSSGMTRDGDLLGDALTLDELDRVASADDLTLDLDQLSGDLELDSAELMNADLSDLDLPELTLDSELLVDDMGSGGNADEMATMLDLARAYIDMGDKDSASSALDEIVRSGSPEQVSEAETLLRKIS